jgi:endoglucanase
MPSIQTRPRLVAGLAALLFATIGASANELVANGDFAAGMDPFWATQNLTPEIVDGRLCATVPGGLANPWDAIIGQGGLTLIKGESYHFAFTATGDPRGPVRALAQMPVDPWTAYITLTPTATPEGERYEGSFVSPVDRDDAEVVFQVGGSSTDWTLCLDDVSLSGGVEAAAYAPETGPAIRVNQLGYLPDGPKRATVVSDATAGLPFDIVAADGTVVHSGTTEPHGPDDSAGLSVHVADFSDLAVAGEGYTLSVNGEASYPFAIAPGLYRSLSLDALSYFYPVRSGIEIKDALAGAAYDRPAGHIGIAPNEGDMDVPCQPVEVSEAVYGEAWTCDYTLDPVGGWYDAGDHGKYVVNGGISVGQLMSTYERALLLDRSDTLAALADNTLSIPESGNDIPDILDEARWELDFIARMIVPEGEDLAGMVHHKVHDNEWTGLPLMPHLSDKKRELHRPSTAATLNAAAVFAQGARLFERHDAAYAASLLDHARTAWAAAQANPAIFATPEDGNSGGGPYDDTMLDDEFYWAAAELFITTRDAEFLDHLGATALEPKDIFLYKGFDWRDVGAYAQLQLAYHADTLPSDNAATIRDLVIAQADILAGLVKANPFGHPYDPPGGHYDWGSTHLLVQNAIILAAAHDFTGEAGYRNAALETMDYVLGRNALNISYVTGYGTVYAQNQHSRWFANQLNPELPNPPKGALSGGPNSSIQDPVAQRLFGEQGCAAQTCYVDDIESWATNEITINWNAALVQAAAWLAEQ